MISSYLQTISNFLPLLLKGAVITVYTAFFSTLIGLLGGLLCGIALSRKACIPVLSHVLSLYVLVMRSTPLYLQLLIMYYALPDLLGINLSPMVAGIIALGCNSSAYIGEIVRGGINALPSGQWDACYALGYGRAKTLLFVIIPQLLRIQVPAITNEFAVLIKETAIASSIGLAELTRVAMNINARLLKPLTVYFAVACIYFVMIMIVTMISKRLEKRFEYD